MGNLTLAGRRQGLSSKGREEKDNWYLALHWRIVLRYSRNSPGGSASEEPSIAVYVPRTLLLRTEPSRLDMVQSRR